MEKFARFILKILGWSVSEFTPPEDKYVLIVAPHTSGWDFIYGRLAFWTKGLPARFLIKEEFFKFPLRRIMTALGGLPVNRGNGGRIVDQAVALFNKYDKLAMIITPEGTRKKNSAWKKGFYHIAMKADVPLYIGYIDYKEKKCSIVKSLPLTGNIQVDGEGIKEIYKNVHAKYPENFSLPQW